MNTQAPLTHLYVEKKNVFKQKTYGLSRHKWHSEFHLSIVIFIDIILLNAILYGSIWLAYYLDSEGKDLSSTTLWPFFLIANLTWLLVISYSKIYGIFGGARLDLKIKELFLGNVIYFGLISLIYNQFFFHHYDIQFLIPALLCFTFSTTLIHLAMRYYYNRVQKSPLSYAVVGGTVSNFMYLKKVFDSTYGNNIYCLGRFAENTIKGARNLGDFSRIEDFIRHNDIAKLLYVNSNLRKEELQQIMQLCRRHFVEFEIVPKEIDLFQKGIQVEQMAHLPIFCRKKEPLYQFRNFVLKRGFDIVFSILVMLLLLSWLYPIVALLIKLESPGPVLFRQKRTGYWNKPFTCYKFRTMRENEVSDKLQATKNDARITRVGAFLRRTNLDELPQFLNVFKGEMSVVGPRPHMLQHTEDYAKLIDHFMIRHEVKPGITGWAQVSGWRGPTEKLYQMAKRVEFDVNYIENWSFWFDCKCIFLTVFNMIKGEENAF